MEHASHLSPETLLRHEEFVLRLARTLVRGEADAEEVAQRTLVSALEHPPRHGALRAWLVRVTRNHATEMHRTERRRAAREQRAARPEAVAAEGTAMERLELEHGVVRAVLALDEPYKSVVVATYYEGLAPAEIAARSGVPASTVRSQLTRAHEMLRAKLDRTHGERGTWMSGLTGLLALRGEPDVAAAGAVPTSSGVGWPLAIGLGIAACVAVVFVLRTTSAPPRTIETATTGPLVAPVAASADTVGDPSRPSARTVAESASADLLPRFMPASEPAKLLEQSRQIKELILEPRLTVSAEERARAGLPTDTASSGVVRLLDRNRFGDDFTLPWMRQGGSYYSFTERVHDYNRRPQIALQDRELLASPAGGRAVLIDLGVRRLADVPASLAAPAWLAPAQRFLWEVAHAEVDGASGATADAYSWMFSEAVERGELDDAAIHALDQLRVPSAEARMDHAYLARCISKDEYDVLVAIEVVALSDDQCTIAWRILESRPVANPSRISVPSMRPEELQPPSLELAAMSEAELLLALGAVRMRADELLFLQFAPEIEQRFGSWRAAADAGLARLIPAGADWTELASTRNGGSSYSFVAHSHLGPYDVYLQRGFGAPSFSAGSNCGAIADLGAVSIESVEAGTIEALGGELGTFLVRHEFAHPSELPSEAVERRQAVRAAQSVMSAAGHAFATRAIGLGTANSWRAVAGHTYAFRTVQFGSHDILVAVHVAAVDEHGIVFAWRILKRWPVLAWR